MVRSVLMDFIRGVTFGYLSKKGDWEKEEAFESLHLLKDRCAASHIVLPVVVEQDTIHSTTINWRDESVLGDEEVLNMVAYAKSIGLEVVFKPMLNVSDGTWRAHINFFDHDVPCEPKWSDWFEAYTEFIVHYAKLAEESQSDMFVIGCEMVNTDRREQEWRELIKEVRKYYSGPITYNCDKYQENHVSWWDAVDVISSSAYYPINTWDEQLPRIEKVVKEHNKPFFFCEAGCPSREGSKLLPNDWELKGQIDLSEQEDWYRNMFKHTSQEPWIQGFGLWDWKALLYPIEKAEEDTDYALYGKPAEQIVFDYYKSVERNETSVKQ